ncbi:MAG TPA: desulfoferrodoxin [Spirochaetales bacterium]|nr:desulfoferrodoxin [Spirochaetales bacterium]HRY54843.1 desulfoferrodoxin [Spirochaetia bacterium]HRZ66278.1 desulfoferrodoxin [Spirochaetia bacterium]
MAALLTVYKCEVCGNIVELVHSGGGQLVCCGQPMKALAENSSDGAKEKHVPAIEKTAEGYKVSVGSVAHPMEEAHYIEWIELLADGIAYRAFLKPGDKPEATFCVKASKVSAREYCNKHGLWKA